MAPSGYILAMFLIDKIGRSKDLKLFCSGLRTNPDA